MFGENNIIGSKELTVDDKHRIKLPGFTFVEPKEELVFFLSVDRNYLLLATDRVHDTYINTMFKYFNIDPTLILTNTQRERETMRILLARNSRIAEVDSNKRITLPSDFITKLDIKDKVYMIGDNKMIRLYPSEEASKELNDIRSI